MNDFQDLLDKIRTNDGYVNIRCLGNNNKLPTKYKNFKDSQEAVSYAFTMSEAGYDVYFNTSEISDEFEGSSQYFKSAKSLPIDIDVDPANSSKYANKAEALTALKSLSKQLFIGIGKPLIIIDSGLGIHAHIIFSRPITKVERRTLGIKLLVVANERLGLKLDPTVTKDVVRIMRIPGTYNYKKGGQHPVTSLWNQCTPIAPEQLESVLNSFMTEAESYSCLQEVYDATCSEDKKAPEGDIFKDSTFKEGGYDMPHSSWQVIKARSMEEIMVKIKEYDPETKKEEPIYIKQSAGCEVVRRGYIFGEHLPEEVWRGALSWIQHTMGTQEERIQWASEFSMQDNRYNENETWGKILRTEGKPYKCSTIYTRYPDICKNCPNKGKITIPLQLSKVYKEAAVEELNVFSETAGTFLNVTPPAEYPVNYFRKEGGGVIYRGKIKKVDDGEDMQGDDSLVTGLDLWMTERTNLGEDIGEAGVWCLITPHDGIKHFIIPSNEIGTKEMMKKLYAQGAIYNPKVRDVDITNYVKAWSSHEQYARAHSMVRHSFGWHDNNTRFLIGAREISMEKEIANEGTPDDRLVFSPLSEGLKRLAPVFQRKGEFSAWKKIVNTYNNPGNEMRAFAFFASLGSVLYNRLNIGGCVIHLHNTQSGTGKSTIQMVGQSIFGHPADGLLNKEDTAYSRYQRLGLLNHLPGFIDEVTGIDAHELQTFMFSVSHNRGRNRMEGSSNTERVNNTKWATMVITSGNDSLRQKLRQFRGAADGEVMRLIELVIPPDTNLTKQEADKLFHIDLPNNYGHAGEMFIRHIITQMPLVDARLEALRVRLDGLAGFKSKERFYSAAVACAFTAAEIAKEIGIHDIDIERVIKVVVKELSMITEENTSFRQDHTAIMPTIGTFIADNVGNITMLSASGIAYSGVYRSVVGIYNVTTKELALSKDRLVEFCVERATSYDILIRELRSKNMFIREDFVNLLEGTSLPSAKVKSIVLKWDDGFGLVEAPITDTLN